MTPRTGLKWWQKAVFYQIYPRSFADGNGDGIGDLRGMISKLDYLASLGIDAVWLSPHYPSPFIDCGYDVSDYCSVAKEYGDLDLFKEFLEGLHSREIRLVLDLVLNHTSDQHPWFIESRSSLKNPKRDWYIWKKGKHQEPPTNWFSAFGGSAWEYDSFSDEYYYHYFFKEQPDLNWSNPLVQNAMFGTARFWLDLGVDGFRLDAVGTIFEDETYPDLNLGYGQEELFRMAREAQTPEDHQNLMKSWKKMFLYQVDQPRVHQVARDLRKVIDEYDDRILIGETDDVSFYGQKNDEFHLNFNFPLMQTRRLSALHVQTNQRHRLSTIPAGAWPCNTLGNHDSPRVYSNFGDGKHNAAQARLYLMLLLTLKGTPFLYNGEEIGMSDFLITDKTKFKDPLDSLYYDLEKKVMGTSDEQASLVGAFYGRDKNRTPMQWENQANAGFCPVAVEPWLPINQDYEKGINVGDQLNQSRSLLNYYRKLLNFRKENSSLFGGIYKEIDTRNKDLLCYLREDDNQKLTILLNMSVEQQSIPNDAYGDGTILFATDDRGIVHENSHYYLGHYQGLILSHE